MRGPYKYEILSKYPHVSASEADIWTRFIAKFPGFFDQVWYDVQIGGIRGDLSDLKDEWKSNAEYLGKYKIDVLGLKDGVYTIIELKKSATTKALGEVWAYDFLFKQEWKPENKVKNMIITDEEMPNIRQIAEAEEVDLVVV